MGSAVNGALRARRRSLGATSDRRLTRMNAQGQTAGGPSRRLLSSTPKFVRTA